MPEAANAIVLDTTVIEIALGWLMVLR